MSSLNIGRKFVLPILLGYRDYALVNKCLYIGLNLNSVIPSHWDINLLRHLEFIDVFSCFFLIITGKHFLNTRLFSYGNLCTIDFS
jgi:hypothetical protein